MIVEKPTDKNLRHTIHVCGMYVMYVCMYVCMYVRSRTDNDTYQTRLPGVLLPIRNSGNTDVMVGGLRASGQMLQILDETL